MIVYVSIGNSDDKLTQADWSDFYRAVDEYLRRFIIHGAWQSVTSARWQNACWCLELPDNAPIGIGWIKDHLRDLAIKYRQDSIAWAEVKDTEFLGAK